MQSKRIMRFIGNRPVPEPELFASNDPMIYYLGVDWGQKTPKSMTFADLCEFSKTCPNPLDSDFRAIDKTDVVSIYTPSRALDHLNKITNQTYGNLFRASFSDFFKEEYIEEKQEEPEQEQFEVNLTEPLVGWRRWTFEKPVMSSAFGLRSFNTTILWRPCEPLEAKCRAGFSALMRIKHSKDLVPTEDCSCGVYAVDDVCDLPGMDYHNEVNVVTGTVYGWGRYVRGDNGWRCQFAYPREFHLRSFQMHLIEPLKAFRVPITIDEPLKVYSPEEEGYSIGNWTEEENRDLGASPDSGPQED